MLRITIGNQSNTTTLTLEGTLSGPWVGELERAWYSAVLETPGHDILLDLRGVTFIAPEGKIQLKWMCGQGAQFKTAGCLGKGIVDEIMRDCNRVP